MSPGEQATLVHPRHFGVTGIITHVYTKDPECHGVRVLLDGGTEEFIHLWNAKRHGKSAFAKVLVPESRYYDYDWQRKRGLL